MRFRGKLIGYWFDAIKKKTVVQFEANGDFFEECGTLLNKLLFVRAYKATERRTLTSNAYYWTLTGQIAAKMKLSTARVHNMHLRDCGYREVLNGKVMEVLIPDEDEEDTLEATTYHVIPTTAVIAGSDGERRVYHLLRGSHDFNKEEMARLIDLTVEEAKLLGIETLTPEELDRMKAAYHEENKV